uniref:SCP-like protein n=1 Tax=Haemonchus contortus TaxID=6289 RepID=A0A7I4YD75_HAECO|nr:SCP extracellular domain containing protein [Haemonchus contortus]
MLIPISIACFAFLAPACLEASYCPNSNNGMTDEIRQIFVDKHNEYRSIIAKGQAKNKLGGFAPKAARMLKVGYDCEVEANTAAYAKECKFEHDPPEQRNYWGQNLWMLGGTNYSKTDSAKLSVQAWYWELKMFGVPDENILTMEVFDRGVGHYTQVAWQSSDKIGCAVEWCPTMTLVACEYNPAGNRINHYIYDIGDPCTTDEDCQCTGCTCSRDEALCVPPGYTTVMPPTTEKPTTTPKIYHPGGMCPENNNGMTDEARKMFVDKHNEYRSLIARGLAQNNVGGFAPKAATMMKVSYDCNVEANVVKWAKTCTFGYNAEQQNNQWGYNTHNILTTMINKTEAAAEGVKAWFNELQQYGAPQDNVFSMEVFNQNVIQEYTQLAWQSSNTIGCGIFTCWNSYTLVACEYNPGGNFIGEPIYTVGDPCTTNQDCQCAGCTCSKDEGLCIAP